MPQEITLKVKADAAQAVASLREFRGEVSKSFGDILTQSEQLHTGLGKLALNPDGINLGVKVALGDLAELNAALEETKEHLQALGRLKFNPTGAPSGGGRGGTDTDPVVSLTRQAEQQKRLDDSVMASKYRNMQISAGQYRAYLAENQAAETTSVQRSIRLNNEMGRVQLDNARRVTADLAQEDRKRVAEARATARLLGGAALVARGTALSGIGGGLRTAGRAMTQNYSLPVAAAGGYAIKQAIDYEADFANVKKTVAGSDADLKALRSDLEALSTQVPESFKSITDIASTVGQLGVARDQVKNVTKDIIQLHVATKLPTETGTLAMVKFANAIGEPAQNIGRLGSVISELDKDSKATSNDVLSMALRIGGVGHAAGLTGPQILAFANAFAGVGVRAQQGGSAISTAIIQIDRATTSGGKKLAQFANVAGMSADQFKVAFKQNAAGALAAFIEGLGKLRDKHVDLVPVMDALGLKSKLEIDALLRASGAGTDLSKALGRVDKAYQDNTATGERYARATGNTQSELIKLRNQANLVAVKLGNDLLPAVQKMLADAERLLHTVSGWIDAFEKLPEPVKQGALEFLAFSVAAGPIVSVVGNIVSGVGSMTRAIGFFKALRTADEMKDILSGLKGVEGGAKDAGDALGGASTKAGGLLTSLKSLAANPFKISVSLLGNAAPLLLPAAAVVGAGLLAKYEVETATKVDPFHSPGEHIVGSGSGSSAVVATMMDKASKGVIDAGLQCGSAISKAFRQNGMNVTATALRDRALKDPRFREQPIGVDSRGAPRYHEGTVFYFPKAGMSKEQHFATAHTDAAGQQLLAEYTKAGTGKYHYRDDRPLASVLYEHGGQMEAFNAVGYGPTAGKPGAAPARTAGGAKYNPALFQASGSDKAAKDRAQAMVDRAGLSSDEAQAAYAHCQSEYARTGDDAYLVLAKAARLKLKRAQLAEAQAVLSKAQQEAAKGGTDGAAAKADYTRKAFSIGNEYTNDLQALSDQIGQTPKEAKGTGFDLALGKKERSLQKADTWIAKLEEKYERTGDSGYADALPGAYKRRAGYQTDIAGITFRKASFDSPKDAGVLLLAKQKATTEAQVALETSLTRLAEKRNAALEHTLDLQRRQLSQTDAVVAAQLGAATTDDDRKAAREKLHQEALTNIFLDFQSDSASLDPKIKADASAKFDDANTAENIRYHAEGMATDNEALRRNADVLKAQADATTDLNARMQLLTRYFQTLGQVAGQTAQEKQQNTIEAQAQLEALQRQITLRNANVLLAQGAMSGKTGAGQTDQGLFMLRGLAISGSFEEQQQALRDYVSAVTEALQGGAISAKAAKVDLAAIKPFAKTPGDVRAIDQAMHTDQKRLGETIGSTDFWGGMASSAAENGSKVLTALLHPKDRKSIFKSMWTDMLGSLESSVTSQLSKMLKNALTGAGTGGGGWLSSIFGGSGASGAPSTAGGLGSGAGSLGSVLATDPGMAASGASGGGFGGLSGLLGSGGGAGAMGSIGAALPWVAAALAVHKLAPGLLGKLFGGWLGRVGPFKKLFHFSGGGPVPGHGTGDTVPAMLTPGEFVLSRPMLQMLANPTPRLPSFAGSGMPRGLSPQGAVEAAGTTVHMYGDHVYHTEMDIKRVKQAWATDKERGRRRGVPAS